MGIVYVVQGEPRQPLNGKLRCATPFANPALAGDFRESYDYYPEQWVSPYIDRRRETAGGFMGCSALPGATR